MAIAGAEEILKKISSQIDTQFPGFIREEGPQFVSFMKAYFEYMEQSGNPVNAARSLRDTKDIDRTVDSFVEYFRKEFMINIPKEVLADKRMLAKHIREFYRSRGSQESYRFLFRALFDTELEFYYPGEDILRASDGRWVQETKLRVGKPYSLNPKEFGGSNVRGVQSGATALVQKITSTIAAGMTIYDMVVENVSGLFIDGERVVDDAGNYVTVSAQVGSLIDTTVVNGGAYHNLNDIIEIGGAGSTETARAVVTETVSVGEGVEIRITNSGSGYTKENTRLIISGGNGTGFQAKVASWTLEPIPVTLGIDIIEPLKNVQIGAGPFFVAGGANTSSVRSKLIGTVKLASGSNTVVGQGTSFNDQLNVGDIIRVNGSANTLRVHSVISAQTFISAIAATTNITVGAAAYTGLAGSNAYSTIGNALKFSASNYHAINAISVINPGYGYTVLPTITIVDTETSPLNVFDGASGYIGRNATVSVNPAPGAIKKLRIISPGQNFNRFENATLLNLSQGNSAIVKTYASANVSGGTASRYLRRQTTFSGESQPIPSGIVTFPGRYVDTKGFLSWNNKLQDNFYYQEFSYVLRVSEALEKYSEIIKKTLHPAGTKRFNELIINSTAPAIVIASFSYSDIIDVEVNESVVSIDTVVGNLVTSASIPTESVTLTDALPFAEVTKNVGHEETISVTDSFTATYRSGNLTTGTESVTSTDVADATYVSGNLTSGTQSVTAADSLPDATYVSVTLDTGTESVTSTDSVVGVYDSVILDTGTESVTSNDTVVGNNNLGNVTPGTETVYADDSTGALVLLGAQLEDSVSPTDTVVGGNVTTVGIQENNGEITPYAATQITTYQSTQIATIVNPTLNLDDTVNRS
jgi:hypothetical protein